MSEERIVLGPFQLETVVGTGGMGAVWKGRHVAANLPVAVKVLTDQKHRESLYLEAFQNEVRAVASLDHRGIVNVLDYGEVDQKAADASGGELLAGSPYLVMEYAARGSLAKYQHTLGWAELRVVLFAILDALAHAHAANVLHRDLKPANILVGCGRSHPGIKLTDFGLAHATDVDEPDELTSRGWGTPQYMSPEQFRGAWRRFGPWTDLYSFGVMAYELVTGHHPFHATTGGGFAQAHTMLDPKPFVPRFAIPNQFEDWIYTLLQKEPDDRFHRAADAAYALHQLGDPEEGSKTFTMLPVDGVGIGSEDETVQRPSLLDPPEPGEEMRIESGDSDHVADTLADHAASTKLLRSVSPPQPTQSLNLEAWADNELQQDSELQSVTGKVERRAPPLPWTWRRPVAQRFDRALLGAGLGLFGLAKIPLVGRESERDILWDALKSVREERRPRAVILTGTAGTGKSRLAQWLSRRAHEVGSAENLRALHGPMTPGGEALRRMLVTHFRSSGLEGGELVDRISRAIRHDASEPEVEAQALADFIAPLERAQNETTRTYMAPQERYLLIRRHLRRASRDRPVIVWLDDVQWGSDGLALASSILDDEEDLAVLVVMTARRETLSMRASEDALVRNLASRERVRVVILDPLHEQATDNLVRELLHLSGDLAEAVAERSGGNPLFAVQIVGDWVERGKLVVGRDGFELRPGASLDIPDDIFDIWNERLEFIVGDPDERVLLEIGAALGQRVDSREWRQACQAYGSAVPAGFMQRVMLSGLLEFEDGGWIFSHGMLRETLERTARAGTRWASIHLACATMLEARYASEASATERRALHLIEAGRLGSAIEPLLAAARYRIARSEFEGAIQLLDQRDAALETVGVDLDRPSWGDGWLVRAEVALQQGQLTVANEYGERTEVAARRNGWSELIPKALQIQGVAEQQSGRLQAATILFGKARAAFDQSGDTRGQARAVEGLARVSHLRGDLAEANALFADALEMFDGVGDNLGMARCINGLGDVARRGGDFPRARELARQTMRLAEEFDNPMMMADSLDDIAELDRLTGDFEAAAQGCERAIRLYDSLGSSHSMEVRANLGQSIVRLGRFGEARQLLEEVRTHAERSRDDSLRARASVALLAPLGFLELWELWRVRFDEAEQLLRRLDYDDPNIAEAANFAAEIADKASKGELAEAARILAERQSQTLQRP